MFNSQVDRASYMRYLRVMKRRGTAANYPNLVAKFKDGVSSRSALFKDWFESGESLAETVLTIQKRLTNTEEVRKYRRSSQIQHSSSQRAGRPCSVQKPPRQRAAAHEYSALVSHRAVVSCAKS